MVVGRLLLLTGLVIALAVPGPGMAGRLTVDHQLVEQARLDGDGDGQATFDQLGASLAVDGDVAVAGAPFHDLRGDDAGAVFVLRRVGAGWSREARLTASDAHAGQSFGDSVAARSGLVVAGAPGDDLRGASAGAAYVFAHDGASWVEVAKLSAAAGAPGDGCGAAVAVWGGGVVVACPRDDHGGAEDVGTVRVFENVSGVWAETALLVAADGQPADRFGSSLAVSGDRVVVGARGHDHGVADGGAAYVFTRGSDGWGSGVELLASDRRAGDLFGDAVAMAGEVVAVGAPNADSADVDSGAVYLFTLDGGPWVEASKLAASDGARGDSFGSALALEPGVMVAGAPGSDLAAADGGAVVRFVADGAGWAEVVLPRATGQATGDELGRSVALAGADVLAGAPFVDALGRDSGTVIVYQELGGGWTWKRVVGLGTAARDWFGYAVAIDGDTALVGAPADDRGGVVDAGSCSVYVRHGDQWQLEAVLSAHDGRAFDQFGAAVALEEHIAVVAAPFNDERAPDAGAVYVFARGAGGWAEQAKLVPPDLGARDYLGLDVAVDGTTVIAAAAGGSSAYLFSGDGAQWSQEARLQPYPRPPVDVYFAAVAISGDLAVVGGAADPEGSSVSVYRRGGGAWQRAARLVPPDPVSAVGFGDPVALVGDTVLVGAPRERVADLGGAGAVYVFSPQGSSWGVADRLTAPEPAFDQVFGFDVAGDGARLVVGSPWAGTVGYGAGSAFLFEAAGESWDLVQELRPAGGQPGDQLGFGVALAGDTVVAGAWAMDGPQGTPAAGAAFVFSTPAGASPQAGFSWAPATPLVGELVTFTDTSTGVPESWLWRFGDGASSSEQSPVHSYVEPGAYEVALTVANAFGDDTLGAVVSVVEGPPAASFAWSPAAPVPGQEVRFFDTSRGAPVSWSWSFGDGAGSSQPSPNHVFAAAGRYAVRLEVAGPLGQAGTTVEVVVSEAPEPLAADLSLPAVARVPGVGAVFTSRVDLLNPTSEPLTLSVRYTSRSDLAAETRATEVVLEARRMKVVEDPLSAWFGFTGSEAAVGSLVFTEGDGLTGAMIQSVITGRNPDGTEYGQLFPAARADDGLGAGSVSYLPATVDATRNRVNLGIMALEDGSRVSVVPVDPIGNALASSLTVELDGGGNRQVNDAYRVFGLEPLDDILFVVAVEIGTVVAYASVVDGRHGYAGTNDPTTLRPLEGSNAVTLLELGSIQGFNEFSSSASVTNLGEGRGRVRADLYLRGEPGVAHTNELELEAGDTYGSADFVADVFGVEGIGTVVLSSLDGVPIAATGRVFAVFRDDDGSVVGTAGQLMRGLGPGSLLAPGEPVHLLGLLERAQGGALERSHLAAFNPGPTDGELHVSLFDGATGAREGDLVVPVRAGELVQVNSVIPRVNPDARSGAKWLEVVSTVPLHAAAFRVNAAGDPVTLEPLRD